ncbi:probable G-protein coupled receptor 139 [Rhincodon typus]|uniref:probable G-protein coupled receptor 139 n=1 Tax=Rhincodon typus TaxID=259920 RepID=UPI00202EB3D9|nr:probable G-protein coupled receptor 139 [Rhincodon typus]
MHGQATEPFYAICYPILAVIGVPANLAVIIILSRGRCGLSHCVTFYLLALAVTDFLVIISGCILNRIGGIYFSNSVMFTTQGCTLSTVVIYTTRDGSVWLTVAFTIDRFVSICCHSLKIRYCTQKTASWIIGMLCVLSCAKNVPYYFVFQPLYVVDGVSWFCDIKLICYTSPAWLAYDWLDHILTPCLPFLVILLLNILTVRHILATSRIRQKLCITKNHGDLEMSNRKKSIVLLFAISLSFLLLWAAYIVHYLYGQLTGEGYTTPNDPWYSFQEITNMFQLVNSLNNVFIFAVAQKRFREEAKKLIMYPFTWLIGCFKHCKID